MRNAERVRQMVVADVDRMVRHLRIHFGLFFGDDRDLLLRIGEDRHTEIMVTVANALMRELGDGRAGERPARDDRTRRIVNKRTKRPRGVTRAQLATGDTYE